MKKLILGAALVAFCASPVLAREYQRADVMPSARVMHQLRGINAQASAPADGVYFNGHLVGTDPDPGVRLSFQRDPDISNR